MIVVREQVASTNSDPLVLAADGRAALYAVLNIERTKIRLPLDIAVTSAEWDPVTERIKGRGQEVKDKNLIISNAKAKISDILVRARLTGETLTKEGFLAISFMRARFTLCPKCSSIIGRI